MRHLLKTIILHIDQELYIFRLISAVQAFYESPLLFQENRATRYWRP